MAVPRFITGQTALLVVDLQEKLLPAMQSREQLLGQSGRLIDGARILKLPILLTEHYRKGLGGTDAGIMGKIGQPALLAEKVLFSACVKPVLDFLSQNLVRQVIVCGVEAHVCVMQSCLDLADRGYVVGLATDAISSRREGDREMAVRRLTQAGVVPTTVESVLFELMREAGTELFKAMLPVVK